MTQVGSDDLDALAALSSVSISLSASFPLPFRILVLVSLGALCWALNLHVLHLMGIDTAVVLDIRSASSPNEHIHPSTLYPPVYQLAACLAVWTGLCWILGFQVVAGGDGQSAVGKMVAAMSLFLAVALLFLPADRLKKTERMLLIRSLKRTVTDSIFRPVPFCDVILADILTSFARVLADFWVCICIVLFITHGEDDPLVEQYRNLGVPIITALPYLFRFRQCIAEYFTAPLISPSLPAVISTATSTLQVPGNGHAASSHGHHHHQPSIFVAPASASSTPASPRTRALFNALKYSTAFPVILFSALQNGRDPYNHPEEPTTLLGRGLTAAPAWFSSMTLFRLWLFSVLINSLYSFWWDVTNDWGLHLLSPTFKSTFPYLEAPKGGTWLRRTMLLPDNSAYVAVVLLDLVLRFTWSLKLSPHLHSIHEIDLGIFMLQALEVLRRWIWVYGRIEWEAVRKGGDALEERMRLRHSDSDLNLPLRAAGGKSPPPPLSPPLASSQMSGSVGLDRRISASHRKPNGTKQSLGEYDYDHSVGVQDSSAEPPKR
ncbi:EXS-domain-containing protein [Cystobasidium minutum MCA 4210]|uniref:EXS-domain-containing protein n=1 Tax=Cystobasidium minutum MCA 4210 TaxID=1397322 RepID=UPI0034CD43D3|eukprot:jgi/Rhomi1/192336/gm1.550_g